MKGQLFILLCLLLSSCVSDIDFEVPGQVQNSIYVNAKVIKGDSYSTILLDGGSVQDFIGIGQAATISEVQVFNVTKGQSINVKRTGFNQYKSIIPNQSDDLHINFEDQYQIQIVMSDGRTIRSYSERILHVPKIEKIEYSFEQKEVQLFSGDIVEGAYCDYTATLSKSNNPLYAQRVRWLTSWVFKITDIRERVCYIEENLGALNEKILDLNTLNAEKITNLVLSHSVTNFYNEASCTTIIQESLSDSAYQYFQQVKDLGNRDGSIFDTAPGQIITNLYVQQEGDFDVFGYFYLTEQDTVRLYVDASDQVDIYPHCFPPTPPSRIEPICINCLNVPTAKREPPSWWQD